MVALLVELAAGILHTVGGFVKAKARYNPGLLTVVPWLVLGSW